MIKTQVDQPVQYYFMFLYQRVAAFFMPNGIGSKHCISGIYSNTNGYDPASRALQVTQYLFDGTDHG